RAPLSRPTAPGACSSRSRPASTASSSGSDGSPALTQIACRRAIGGRLFPWRSDRLPSPRELGGDRGGVAALVARPFELVGTRLARAVGAGKRAGAIGRAAADLVH